VVHGIHAALEVHLDWAVLLVNIANIFNTILCKAIFHKFRAMRGQLSQLFLLFILFMAFKFVCILVIILLQGLYLSFFFNGHPPK